MSVNEQKTAVAISGVQKIKLSGAEKYFHSKAAMDVAMQYRQFYLKFDYMMNEKTLKKIYEALTFGDPKQRTLRALYTSAYVDYMKEKA